MTGSRPTIRPSSSSHHSAFGGVLLSPRPRFSLHEPRETLCDFAINFAPERHHQIGDAIELLPAPLIEFRRLAVARRQRIDLAVMPGKTQREPFLALAAEFGQP